jgi:hypothetical protein
VIDSEEGATEPSTETLSEPSDPLADLLSVDPAPSIVTDSDSGAVLPPTEIDSPSDTCADLSVVSRMPVSRIVAFAGADVPRGSRSRVALSVVVDLDRGSVILSPVSVSDVPETAERLLTL